MEMQEPPIGSHTPCRTTVPNTLIRTPGFVNPLGKEITERVQYGASLVATEGLCVDDPLHARDKVA